MTPPTLSPTDLATLRACVHLAIVDVTIAHNWDQLAILGALVGKLQVMSELSDKTEDGVPKVGKIPRFCECCCQPASRCKC